MGNDYWYNPSVRLDQILLETVASQSPLKSEEGGQKLVYISRVGEDLEEEKE